MAVVEHLRSNTTTKTTVRHNSVELFSTSSSSMSSSFYQRSHRRQRRGSSSSAHALSFSSASLSSSYSHSTIQLSLLSICCLFLLSFSSSFPLLFFSVPSVSALNVRINAGDQFCAREIVPVTFKVFFHFDVTHGGNKDLDVSAFSIDWVSQEEIEDAIKAASLVESGDPELLKAQRIKLNGVQPSRTTAYAVAARSIRGWSASQHGEEIFSPLIPLSELQSYLNAKMTHDDLRIGLNKRKAQKAAGETVEDKEIADLEADLAKVVADFPRNEKTTIALDSKGEVRLRIVSVCFSNKHSTFVPKWLSFSLKAERLPQTWVSKHDAANIDPIEHRIGIITTKMELLSSKMTRLRTFQRDHRSTVEDANERVWLWSFIQVVVLVVMSGFQIHFLKRFLEKKTFI